MKENIVGVPHKTIYELAPDPYFWALENPPPLPLRGWQFLDSLSVNFSMTKTWHCLSEHGIVENFDAKRFIQVWHIFPIDFIGTITFYLIIK